MTRLANFRDAFLVFCPANFRHCVRSNAAGGQSISGSILGKKIDCPPWTVEGGRRLITFRLDKLKSKYSECFFSGEWLKFMSFIKWSWRWNDRLEDKFIIKYFSGKAWTSDRQLCRAQVKVASIVGIVFMGLGKTSDIRMTFNFKMTSLLFELRGPIWAKYGSIWVSGSHGFWGPRLGGLRTMKGTKNLRCTRPTWDRRHGSGRTWSRDRRPASAAGRYRNPNSTGGPPTSRCRGSWPRRQKTSSNADCSARNGRWP